MACVYGHREGDCEVPVSSINENGGGKWKLNHGILHLKHWEHVRKPMAYLQKHRVSGIAMPRNDTEDYISTLTGCIHRVAAVVPDFTTPELKDFALQVFKQFLQPLEHDEVMTFKDFLSDMKKPQKFKDEMLAYHNNRTTDFMKEGKRESSSFVKKEGHSEFKHSRTISGNSKKMFSWDTQSYYSRIIKSMEKQIYDKLPGLVKHMTPHQRAKLVHDLGDHYVKTICDYSSYEGSFTKGKMESVQFVLYDYMLCKLPKQTSDSIKALISGENKMVFSSFVFMVTARKMSGDPDTSLSNVMDNWCDWLYLLHKQGVPPETAARMLLVEGDDNASCLDTHVLQVGDFAKLGLKAKLVSGLELESTGLCQLYVGPDTGRARIVINKDPWKALASISVIPQKYGKSGEKCLKSLWRGMAMGMLHQHAGAPVVSVLASKVLELTRGTNVREHHWKDVVGYHNDVDEIRSSCWKTLSAIPVADADRALVENQFGMTVEMQLYCEEIIRNWKGGNLDIPVEWFPEQWAIFSELYVTPTTCSEWVAPLTDRRKDLLDVYLKGAMD